MLGLPILIVVDDDFLRVVGVLPADLGEEGVETIVVTHRPAVERVVMALRALDAHPHEHLGHVFAEFKLIELSLVEVHRRVGDRATVGGQQVDDHLVQRLVLADTISQPVVVEERVFVERRLVVSPIDAGANLQQLGPLHHPELGKFFTLQEHVNQLGALIGALIR